MLLWIFSLGVFAQNITVRGSVNDENGEALIGVTVQVQGTSIGTVTDFDGNYVLENVGQSATLEVSYVGMQSAMVSVNGRTTINVVLEADTEILDELVFVFLQAGDLDHLFNLSRCVKAAQTLGLGYEGQVLSGGHIHVKRRHFGEIADELLCLDRLLENVVSVDCGSSRRCRKAAGDYVHGGGLSRAVGAEKSVDFAFFNRKADAVQRAVRSVLLYEIFYFYQSIFLRM